MNLDEAIRIHSNWKVKFRHAIAKKETFDVPKVSADNQCELGQWLQGEARAKLSNLPAYSELLKQHAAFHREAAGIAQLINLKKYPEAESALNHNPYAALSGNVAVAVLKLKEEAHL